MKRSRHDRSQAGQRENVDRVVMEDRHQPKDFMRAQIFKIEIWDKLARQIALPFHAQDLVFQIHQPATIETQIPQPAGAEQQIQMLETTEGRALSDHAETRLEQRLIVSTAVVGDQHLELFQMLLERAQLTGLFTEFAHEELTNTKSLRRDATYANQKRICSRASRQARRLGIQEAPLLYGNATDLAAGDRFQQIRGHIFQIGYPDAAVPAMPFV